MSGKILLIEDNPITRKLVRFTLEQRGYTVVEAADGKTALESLAEGTPDLVLEDLVLPDIDGFALAEQLRQRFEAQRGTPRVPIIALSGLVSKADEGRISSAGFADFVAKPIEPSRLLQIVQAHLPKMEPRIDQFGAGRRLLVV